MSQQDVLKVLQKAKKPLCSSEIAKEIGINTSTVSCNLCKLVKYNEVKSVIIDRDVEYGKHLVKYYFV